MTNEKLVSLIEGKKVLFISTKNRDYLRNVQEIRLLEEHAAAVTVVAEPDLRVTEPAA